MQTNVSHIYATGDATVEFSLLTLPSMKERQQRLHASGEDVKVNYHAVPRCIYTAPEIASVGLSEKGAREQYGDILIGEFPLQRTEKLLF